ncbi:hypothetical protein DL546_007597 [Coniochaeta pulveracea]|uniref:Uncharacterized protein n=1 Tax=Coniochaeta pulveracea TaxID=177199 RepID=A0A420YB00_9PEZI|nr:hypothetical protein DL546_007597 [Coniochaeta pulveracea]
MRDYFRLLDQHLRLVHRRSHRQADGRAHRHLVRQGLVDMTLGAAYINSVFAALAAELNAADFSASGETIRYTPGPTAGPSCQDASNACGGTICSGYWCTPSPTGYPPNYPDPKDPSSGGFSAPTTSIGSTPAPPPTTTLPPPPPPTTTPDPCASFDRRACGSPLMTHFAGVIAVRDDSQVRVKG